MTVASRRVAKSLPANAFECIALHAWMAITRPGIKNRLTQLAAHNHVRVGGAPQLNPSLQIALQPAWSPVKSANGMSACVTTVPLHMLRLARLVLSWIFAQMPSKSKSQSPKRNLKKSQHLGEDWLSKTKSETNGFQRVPV